MSEHGTLDQTTAPAVIRRSRYTYGETVARLTASIAQSGATLFATIDQRAAAQSAGLDLRPTTLLIFGNPKGGTPLMDALPVFGLELPVKLLIWEEHETVNVAYLPVMPSARRYGLRGKDAPLAAIDAALEKISTSVV